MKNKKEKIVLITGGCGFLGWEHAKSLIELSFYKATLYILNQCLEIVKTKKATNKTCSN